MSKEKKAKDPLAPRATKVTKPTAKASKTKARLPNKSFKSAERITESDEEDEAPRNNEPAPLTKQLASADGNEAMSIDASSDSSSEDDEDKARADKDAAKMRIQQLPQTNNSDLSDEDSSDDDGDASDSEDVNTGSKSDTGARSVPKPATNGKSSVAKPDFENDEQDAPQEQVYSRSSGSSQRNGRLNNDIDESQLRPTTKFKVHGFHLIENEAISSDVVDLLKPKNTSQKEIWYISAPASLPITALKEVALEKFAKQQPIMTYDGAEYSLVSDPAARDATCVLLPDTKRKGDYAALRTPVNHVLQFQQVINVQSKSNTGMPQSSTQVLQDTHVATKPKKLRPKGMRMRFRPSGFGDGDLGAIGDSDSDDLTPSSARQSLIQQSGHELSKRKEQEDEVVEAMTEKRKKKKKDKSKDIIASDEGVVEKNETYVLEATTAIDADQPTAPPEAKSSEGKKKKKKERHELAVASNISMENADADVGLDSSKPEIEGLDRPDEKEDKKKRKKEKKRQEGGGDVVMQDVPMAAEKERQAETMDVPTKDKDKKKKKDKEKLDDIDDVPTRELPNSNELDEQASATELSKADKKEKKKKKDKAAKADLEAVEATVTTANTNDDIDLSEKKRRKKEKKEKKRAADLTEA